jgi:hypothetical protein
MRYLFPENHEKLVIVKVRAPRYKAVELKGQYMTFRSWTVTIQHKMFGAKTKCIAQALMNLPSSTWNFEILIFKAGQ